MNKKNITYIVLLLVLTLACFFIWKYFTDKNTISTDAERFSNEYTEVGKNNVFKYVSASKIIDILENGSGVIYLGFPECGWCQQYVKHLNESAIENNIDTIYYYNIKDARANNTANYQKIVNLLEDYLLSNDEGKKRVYVPNVTFVKSGIIVGNDNETSVVTEEDGSPTEYWTTEKIENLKTRLSNYMEQTKETVCTTCN